MLQNLFSCLYFGENSHIRQDWTIPDFRNRSHSDVNGKYQYKEKPMTQITTMSAVWL